MTEKIQKVLANLGLASRREIERWVEQGRIEVNGKLATIGDRIDGNDKVTVDGRRVKLNVAQELRIIMYNKPEGEVVTREDPEGRTTVFERLPHCQHGRWINIGRLDINTSGLLLFTNSGEIANKLMHPKYHIEREYAVRVFGDITTDKIKNLVKGVQLEDGFARFEDIVDSGGRGSNRWFHVVIAHGRNRIVRRLWESQGLQVSRLSRVRFGNIFLKRELAQGRCKEVSGTLKNDLLELLQSEK